jgi:hypothetical protein
MPFTNLPFTLGLNSLQIINAVKDHEEKEAKKIAADQEEADRLER